MERLVEVGASSASAPLGSAIVMPPAPSSSSLSVLDCLLCDSTASEVRRSLYASAQPRALRIETMLLELAGVLCGELPFDVVKRKIMDAWRQQVRPQLAAENPNFKPWTDEMFEAHFAENGHVTSFKLTLYNMKNRVADRCRSIEQQLAAMDLDLSVTINDRAKMNMLLSQLTKQYLDIVEKYRAERDKDVSTTVELVNRINGVFHQMCAQPVIDLGTLNLIGGHI